MSKAFIDTNVLLYALEMHPVYAGKAIRVLEMVDKGELKGVISALVSMEICWFLESIKRFEDIGLVLDVLRGSRLETVPVTGEDVTKAGELKQRYSAVEMNDLVNLCIMRREGLSTIYTNDKHFHQFNDINPVF